MTLLRVRLHKSTELRRMPSAARMLSSKLLSRQNSASRRRKRKPNKLLRRKSWQQLLVLIWWPVSLNRVPLRKLKKRMKKKKLRKTPLLANYSMLKKTLRRRTRSLLSFLQNLTWRLKKVPLNLLLLSMLRRPKKLLHSLLRNKSLSLPFTIWSRRNLSTSREMLVYVTSILNLKLFAKKPSRH